MLYFFDTSALQYRYISAPKSRGIRRTISDGRNECFISSVTILEIASTFGNHCRRNHLSLADYRKLDRKFWKDVRRDVLHIREPGWRENEKALHLLEYAGAYLKRNITSSDALIAASCLELALERSTKVKFTLEDRRLYNVIRQLPAYKSVIKFRFLGAP